MTDETIIHFPNSYEETLKTELLKLLPKHTVAFEYKKEFKEKYKFLETQKVIENAKFMRFNSKKTTNMLIFDIDNFEEDFNYCKPTITYMHNYFEQMTGITPTWVLATDKGYHIGVMLEKPIFTTYKDNQTITKDHLKLLELKRRVTMLIGGDPVGSHRSYGIWRNPLTHIHIYNPITTNIEDMFEEFDVVDAIYKKVIPQEENYNYEDCLPMKLKSNNEITKAIKEGFIVGNRNNYIFAYGYKILYEDRKMTDEALEKILQNYNKNQKESLTQKEISDIVQSILKFKPTMYITKNIKKRGKLSNLMWKLNIHGISKRRAFAGWHTSKERTTKTLKKIIGIIIKYLEQGLTPTNKQIASEISMSLLTVTRQINKHINTDKIKYWKERLQNAKLQNQNKIGIRPFEISEILDEIVQEFKKFTPSLEVIKQDFARKKEYLKQFSLLAS